MRRRELAAAVAEATGLSRGQAEAAVAAALGCISDELVRAGRVELRGLGTFRVVRHGERHTYVPPTGQVVATPARRAVRFQPVDALLERLNAEAEEGGGG